MLAPKRLQLVLLASALASTAGCAMLARNQIGGQVVDRGGEPVHRAIVSLKPGNVQLVTDRDGHFLIDYRRDEDGKRRRLQARTDYVIEVFKPGFHTWTAGVDYRWGPLTLAAVTLAPETIEVQDQGENIDPGLFSESTQGAGAHYEGQ